MSLITAPDFHSEENPTITYSIDSDAKITEAGIFNSSGTQSYVPYERVDEKKTSHTFELNDEQIRNFVRAMESSSYTVKNTLTIRFYLRTTLADGKYRYSYLTKTFSVGLPTITASVEDVNEKTIALTGDNKKLIKYYSNAKATMSATAKRGATINDDFYIIDTPNKRAYGTTHTFNNVETNVFLFSAEDSLGGYNFEDLRPDMVEYIKPTCNIDFRKRPDALGNMTVVCTGGFFNKSFGAVTNTLTVECRYTKAGSAFNDNWISMDVSRSGDSYVATADFTIDYFDQYQVYAFEARATDKLTTVASDPYRAKNTPVFHWGEEDFVFEVPVAFNGGILNAASLTSGSEESDTYVGNKTITGNLRLKGDGTNYGNYLLFGDSTFCYIAELTDDEMTLKAKKIHLNTTNGVYIGGSALPLLDKGTWTPALNSSAISSYTTQYGWYSKIGQSVTVGFYIKATCKSGYNSTAISISGLPFTPMYSGAGGGMCSGAYVAANQNFQCYVAETGKTITTRTQACNNTSSTNLTTSASGCWYPSGGGEITLSGTITFIANS